MRIIKGRINKVDKFKVSESSLLQAVYEANVYVITQDEEQPTYSCQFKFLDPIQKWKFEKLIEFVGMDSSDDCEKLFSSANMLPYKEVFLVFNKKNQLVGLSSSDKPKGLFFLFKDSLPILYDVLAINLIDD